MSIITSKDIQYIFGTLVGYDSYHVRRAWEFLDNNSGGDGVTDSLSMILSQYTEGFFVGNHSFQDANVNTYWDCELLLTPTTEHSSFVWVSEDLTMFRYEFISAVRDYFIEVSLANVVLDVISDVVNILIRLIFRQYVKEDEQISVTFNMTLFKSSHILFNNIIM